MSTSSPPPSPTPKSPQPKRRRVAPKIISLNVPQADLELKPTTFLQDLERQKFSGFSGLSVSLGLHICVLVILATIVHQMQEREILDEIVIGWIDPSIEKARSQKVVPVRIAAIPSGTFTSAPRKVEPLKNPTVQASPEPGQSRSVKPAAVKKMFEHRRKRIELNMSSGDAEGSTKALALGLAWMARQQRADGSWQLDTGSKSRGFANYPDAGSPSLKTDTGATALALLSFLGVGETHLEGKYQEDIKKGIDWLLRMQKPNGDLHDWEELGRQTAFYAHSQATIVLCEALALTGDETLREPAQRAVQFLLDSQYLSDGGWKYQPQSGLTTGDLSVTGWALMALHTARAAGLDVPSSAFERASQFLDRVQVDDGFRYKYMEIDPLENVSPAMTAEGLLCRQWLGWERDHPAMQEGVQYLLDPAHAPEWSAGSRNVYQWYYTAQLLHNVGGETWSTWFRDVKQVIAKHQNSVGGRAKGRDTFGSWHPTSPTGSPWEYGDKAGRLYVTAMCLLILETPLRHAAIYAETDAETEESTSTDSP
ncbi:MAG: prenyltransferase/squalene oxidase repeat-containing protein [Planctomycetaceae bacterium]